MPEPTDPEQFGPGDPDAVMFDESFIRGGIHEPSARTRDAIARYGNQRTSWRHGGAPQLDRERPPRRVRRPRGRIATISVVSGLAVCGAAVYLIQHVQHRDRPGPVIAAVPTQQTISASSGPSPSDSHPPVVGIEPTDAIGTCYSSPDPTSRTALELSVVSCASRHNFELIALAQAADRSTYPPESYWNGPVATACYQDLLKYTGLARGHWPAGLASDQFVPEPDGWATGDRTIHCIADTIPAHRGSVRKTA